jgi:hypothetical protein
MNDRSTVYVILITRSSTRSASEEAETRPSAFLRAMSWSHQP